jgi:hypothetical protein
MSDKCVEINTLSLFAIVRLSSSRPRTTFLPRILGPAMFSRIKLVIDLIRQLDGEYRAVRERIDKSPGLPVDTPTVPFWTVPPAQLPIDNDAPLPSHVDVLVIGSGITGVSCTRTLLRHGPQGLRILVLEARDVCSGATGRYV